MRCARGSKDCCFCLLGDMETSSLQIVLWVIGQVLLRGLWRFCKLAKSAGRRSGRRRRRHKRRRKDKGRR